jgi:hypothetical protein
MENLSARLHRPNPALDAEFRERSSASGFRRFQEYSIREYASKVPGKNQGCAKVIIACYPRHIQSVSMQEKNCYYRPTSWPLP